MHHIANNQIQVKLFIGMEYECSAGHRQLGMGDFDDGIHLVENDLPLYQQCSYRKVSYLSTNWMYC